MSKIKVMIVDDSSFARAFLGNIITTGGMEVVGEAASADELIEVFRKCKPDVVTLDMTMPGKCGFECTKLLMRENPNIKIVIISSMKDDEMVGEARRLGVAGYVQKPVEDETLLAVLRNATTPGKGFEQLKNLATEAFKEALGDSITRIAKTTAVFGDDSEERTITLGVAAIIGIVGKHSGRMIINLSLSSAEQMAKTVLKREPNDTEEVFAMSAEFANIVAGNACSMINKINKSFGLRVTPPSVFYGEISEIASPNVKTETVCIDTSFGRMYLDIGFKPGVESWT